jgi:hypothetical protein
VCRAVRNDVMSSGEVGGGPSEKIAWMGVAADPARAREKVCFRDEKPREVDVDMLPEGDAGRCVLGLVGVSGTRRGADGVAFFFP